MTQSALKLAQPLCLPRRGEAAPGVGRWFFGLYGRLMKVLRTSTKPKYPISSSSFEEFRGRRRGGAGGTNPKRFGQWALVCVFLILGLAIPKAEAQVSREYQLKAVFLYNFAQFTEWPTNAFAGPNAPIVIGVLGANPFGPALEDTVRGETVDGRPLVVEHYHRADEIKTCHILFISQSETRHTDQILNSLKGKPVLTVADTDTAQTARAIIRFVLENNKIHFQINRDAAREANVVLSSRLLRVAEVTPPEGRP